MIGGNFKYFLIILQAHSNFLTLTLLVPTGSDLLPEITLKIED